MGDNDTKMTEPMRKEEMIDILKGLVFGTFDKTTAKEREALDMAIKVLDQTRWIPVSNPQKELPKDRVLWVTIDDDRYAQDTGGYYWLGGLVVTKIYWDMTEWSDDIIDYVLAYMDYVEPMPYKAESEDEK